MRKASAAAADVMRLHSPLAGGVICCWQFDHVYSGLKRFVFYNPIVPRRVSQIQNKALYAKMLTIASCMIVSHTSACKSYKRGFVK